MAANNWAPLTVTLAYVGIFLLGTATSLEGQTSYTFTPFITSSFAAHSMLSTISVVSSVLNTVLKAPVAKIADVVGRLEALGMLIVFYIVGFVCLSQASSVELFAASQIFYIAGFTGCLLLIQLVIADTSSLVNRSLLAVVPSLPYVWTVWAGPALGQKMLNTAGWRWGLAMWAIIIPTCSMPLAAALWLNRKSGCCQGPMPAEKSQTLLTETQEANMRPSKKNRTLMILDQLDLIGILLLAGGLGLLLVPLTYPHDNPADLWTSWRVWLCLVSGLLVLCSFGWYDARMARFPVLSLRMLQNRTIGCLCGFIFFDWVAFYILNTLFTSFLQVARFRTAEQAGHIQSCFSFASTIVGFLAGILIKYFQKIRIFMWIGGVINILGIALMIPFRTPLFHIAWIVLCQILVGFGSGLYTTPGMVACQAVVPAKDVANATAIYLTVGPLGASFGSAIAGAVWTVILKSQLRQRLPETLWDLIPGISQSIVTAMSYPAGSEIRNAINDSYFYVMRTLCGIAVGVGCLSLVLLFCVENVKIARVPDKQSQNSTTSQDHLSVDFPVLEPSTT
eukprot:Gregarina_sp_Poly_1__7806@NODE_441_length_8354_cov_301_408350_g77_i1_p2_GENE_NODE_441_length_8354_cov_301_408350_g77_i1NODE_441_length_8354_cov_301_408350_g77_i1_p2_ORF_typecomplete_len564_score53_40TRI12/PF06609_13/8_1e77MFS_1/PF07690_16/3_6e08MFS_1/PF07690_16/4_2e16Sugar_tr/PF00083_24/0_00073Sugar_tr/PF00083_24/4_4e02Sugar_tr/PF00083_24/0_063Sugar_tr/PF00083_24/49OATP/PF03137_20/0_029OATP/PF03137_20/0_0027MFS_3/PF05977_13/2_2e02MFS_3/PF05977_13/2_9e03MFS_3/PF05977_13/3_5e02MFS_3/PF05977_13/0_0